MAFSRALKDSILNFFKGTTFTAAPSVVYVALLTTMPADDTGASIVEVNTGVWSNYARQATGTMSAPAGTGGTRSISNSGAVDFGVGVLSGTVTLTGAAWYDAATAGNLLAYAAFGSPQAVVNGVDVSFAIGALQISEA